MNGRVEEIQEAAGRLERMLRALVEDRDRAWAEVARLKKSLDDREMEFLQMDEEYRNAVKKFDEEKSAMASDRQETERQLEEISTRIKALLPLLPDSLSDDGDMPSTAPDRLL